MNRLKDFLEDLYKRYNKRVYVSPDPLEFLYAYKDIKDREIAGLIASCLAYGRVAQILKSVSSVLDILGSPYRFLSENSYESIKNSVKDFRHRFADSDNMAGLLWGIKKTIEKFGSLNNCFAAGMTATDYNYDTNYVDALNFFAKELSSWGKSPRHLIPLPEKGSACKRLNLFLRWMVRKDDVDPGGWDKIKPSSLLVPLDTHLYKISLGLGLTKRNQPNMKTAVEITSSFKEICPDDPVKYDFCLTRFGIRDELNIDMLNFDDILGKK